MNAWVIARNTLGDALRKRVLLVFLLLAMVMLLLALMLQYFTAREQMVTFKSTELAIIPIPTSATIQEMITVLRWPVIQVAQKCIGRVTLATVHAVCVRVR